MSHSNGFALRDIDLSEIERGITGDLDLIDDPIERLNRVSVVIKRGKRDIAAIKRIADEYSLPSCEGHARRIAEFTMHYVSAEIPHAFRA